MYSRSIAVLAILLISIGGCSTVSNEEFDDRLATIDMDGDGFFYGDDCDDSDPRKGLEMAWYIDTDGDGFGDLDQDERISCDPIDGYVSVGGDCDDKDADVNPSSDEMCWDLVDNNCDTLIDDASAVDAVDWYLDLDGDLYGDEGAGHDRSCDDLSETHVQDNTDCDDNEADVYPGAIEYCDSVDNDCDTEVDEDDAADVITWYSDSDEDGFGQSDVTIITCYKPDDFVDLGGDCDDGDSSVYPGAPEYCDGIDHDCDDLTNEDDSIDAKEWFLDYDLDGFGDADNSIVACFEGDGYIADNTDCDDSSYSVNPDAPEYCDGEDNNCDTVIDEDTALDADTWYIDSDADGYGTTTTTTASCSQPSGYASLSTDCDDSVSYINPGADDGPLNDYSCDGTVDSGTNLSNAFIEFPGESSGDMLGYHVGGIGDVDGDGLGDIAMSAPFNDYSGSDAGKVYIFLGSSLTTRGTLAAADADYMFTGASSGDYLGFSFDGGSDIDGDGQVDLIIGAPKEDTTASNAGAVYIVSGPSMAAFGINSTTQMTWNDGLLVGENSGDQAGYSVALVDDYFGDGTGDIVVGAPKWNLGLGLSDAGVVYLFRGSNLTRSTNQLSSATIRITGLDGGSGLTYGDHLGFSVAAIEDVDLDGREDVLVGAPYCDENGVDSGCAYFFLSDTNNNLGYYDASSAFMYQEGSGDNDHYGWRVASAGDFDNDQLGDALISAPGADVSTTNAGEVHLYSGYHLYHMPSPQSYYHYFFQGSSAGDSITGVSAAGDVDGDGIDDILLSAPDYSGGSAVGETYLFLAANNTTPSDYDVGLADYNFIGESIGDESGYSISSAGDVNGDGLDDLLVSAPMNDANTGKVYLILSGL